MKSLHLFLFFLPLFAAGQTVTVSESVSTREDRSYEIINDGYGNVLVFHDKKTNFEVQGFDGQLKMTWQKEIELDKKSPEVVKTIAMGGDFSILYKFRMKADVLLKVHRYNPAANLVDSVTIKNYGFVMSAPDDLQVELSEDKKTVLVWHNSQNSGKMNVVSFHLGRMKLLWEKEFEIDNFVLERDFQQMLVDNEGNMHLILLQDNRKGKNNQPHFDIYRYGESTGNELRLTNLPMQDYLIYNVHFTCDNLNRSLIAGGLYATENAYKAEGYFYLNLPQANPEKPILSFHPFEKDFVNTLLEKEKNKNKGLSEVSVQEVVLRKDGGIILVGELNKEVQRGVVAGGYYTRTGMRPIIDYYYDDVFLVSVHPDGKEHWKTILHKKQYSQDDGAIYSSYFLAKTPAALRVVFNDEVKQENTVSEYLIRGNGEFDRNAVMNTERKELSLRFRDAVQIGSNEFVVPSERRHKLKLVKVTFGN